VQSESNKDSLKVKSYLAGTIIESDPKNIKGIESQLRNKVDFKI
jgi:hypothetical protein